jgi:L-malate glycosyltransferase
MAMRILLVEHTSVVSGGQRSMLELIRALAPDHDVALACPSGELDGAARRAGVRVLSIPESQVTFRLTWRHSGPAMMRMLAAAWRLRRIVARERPAILHANSVRAGLIAILALLRTPLVVHCRDVLPDGRVGRAIRWVVLARADRVVAISRHVARRFAGPGWRARKVRVVDNAVDVGRFDPGRIDRSMARASLGVRARPVLSVIAQITPWKGQDLAIRVLEALGDAAPDAVLLIAGRPKFVAQTTRYDNLAYERDLHELANNPRLDGRVHFLGERDDPERVLAATDVLLVPSIEEPFGRTIIEAMAMGVPVAAGRDGGPAEIVRDGTDGLLVDGRDPARWAVAVAQLLNWPADRRRAARGHAGERFSASRHARVMLEVYNEARGRRSTVTSARTG